MLVGKVCVGLVDFSKGFLYGRLRRGATLPAFTSGLLKVVYILYWKCQINSVDIDSFSNTTQFRLMCAIVAEIIFYSSPVDLLI